MFSEREMETETKTEFSNLDFYIHASYTRCLLGFQASLLLVIHCTFYSLFLLDPPWDCYCIRGYLNYFCTLFCTHATMFVELFLYQTLIWLCHQFVIYAR